MKREPIDVLMIDDDPDICLMAEAVLKFSGLTVKYATTQQGLMDLLQKLEPKVLLMDMLLSGADGRDICRQLRTDEAMKSMHIIMMSAHPDADRACHEAGADDFLEKPFDIDTFTGKIGKAVGRNSV